MILNGWPRPRSRGPQIAGGCAPSKKEVCRRPAIRLISKKMGCCLSPKGFPLKRTRHKRCAMRLPQKVCKMHDVQLAPLKRGAPLTACNRLPPKSKGCRRLAIGFPQKVSTVDGLQQPSGTGEKWVARRRRASRKVIWPEPARRCGKWRGRPSGDGGQCGARRSS